MSVKLKLEHGWFISHEDYINEAVASHGLQTKQYFEILTPFRMDAEAVKAALEFNVTSDSTESISKKRKRKKLNVDELSEEKKLCSKFLSQLRSLKELKFLDESVDEPRIISENNMQVRKLVQELETLPDFAAKFYPSKLVENHVNDIPKWLRNQLVLPKNSSFIMDCINYQTLNELADMGHTFDVIVIDPPWDNKHVKRECSRSKGYTMLLDEDIRRLPFPRLFSDDVFVIVWCTSSKRHQKAVEEWFQEWKLVKLAKWLWLKVTKSGEPVVSLDKTHKQPFEYLFLASKGIRNVPTDRVICSVPSAFQSHKPPLTEILDEILGRENCSQRKCLEVFGRYLLPGWMTIGNQCLKFQNLQYFVNK